MSKKDRQKEGKKELMEGEGLKGLEKKTTEASIITLVLAGLVVSQIKDDKLDHVGSMSRWGACSSFVLLPCSLAF